MGSEMCIRDRITMDDAIYKLYNDGKIDSTQALEFAQEPDQLRKKLY